jgi:hypothetical protein
LRNEEDKKKGSWTFALSANKRDDVITAIKQTFKPIPKPPAAVAVGIKYNYIIIGLLLKE